MISILFLDCLSINLIGCLYGFILIRGRGRGFPPSMANILVFGDGRELLE